MAVGEARPPKVRVSGLPDLELGPRQSPRSAVHRGAYAPMHSYAASRPAVGYDTERAYGRRKQVQ
jgi:hypothetical protein